MSENQNSWDSEDTGLLRRVLNLKTIQRIEKKASSNPLQSKKHSFSIRQINMISRILTTRNFA